MKFLIDQQLPRVLTHTITQIEGCEAVHVRDLRMETADDRTIWTEARIRGCAIITKDGDFSVILRAPDDPQVVWIRMGNCSNETLIARLAAVWPSLLKELHDGAPLIEVWP